MILRDDTGVSATTVVVGPLTCTITAMRINTLTDWVFNTPPFYSAGRFP